MIPATFPKFPCSAQQVEGLTTDCKYLGREEEEARSNNKRPVRRFLKQWHPGSRGLFRGNQGISSEIVGLKARIYMYRYIYIYIADETLWVSSFLPGVGA